MEDQYLFYFGMFVTVLFLIGVVFSIKEFNEMREDEQLQDREDQQSMYIKNR